MKSIDSGREFMKSGFANMDGRRSDQSGGVPQPPLEKPYEQSEKVIKLPKPDGRAVRKADIHACMKDRRSRRMFSDQPLTLVELSLLLWATQGIDRVGPDQCSTFRPAPSAGARHAFETSSLYMLLSPRRRCGSRFDSFERGRLHPSAISPQITICGLVRFSACTIARSHLSLATRLHKT